MRRWWLIGMFILFSALSMTAQTDTVVCSVRKPVLKGHSYHFGEKVGESPFLNSYLAGSIGLGNTGTMNIPGIIVGEQEILSFLGELTFFNAYLDYRQRVNDWLALFVTYQLVGRVGTDVPSILVDGLNSLSGGSIGWLFRVYHTDRFLLTGSLSLQNMSGSFFDIVGYINDLLDSVPDPQASQRIPVMNGGLGWKAAWTLNESVGFLTDGDIFYGESFVRGARDIYFSFGIAVDIDLKPEYNVPLGFNMGYTFSSLPQNTLMEFDHTNILSLRFVYTGSNDYDLGLQFSFYRYELDNIEVRRPWVRNTALNFRMYF